MRVHHQHQLAGRPTGFTLVELVTCIVLAGVLAAIALPKLLDDQSVKERGYADELSSALKYAQTIAASTECDVQVTIDAAGAYSLNQRSAAAGTCNQAGAWTTAVKRADSSAAQGSPPSGVNVSPAAVIVFDRQGEPNTGPTITVGSFAIAIDPHSGWITLTP